MLIIVPIARVIGPLTQGCNLMRSRSLALNEHHCSSILYVQIPLSCHSGWVRGPPYLKGWPGACQGLVLKLALGRLAQGKLFKTLSSRRNATLDLLRTLRIQRFSRPRKAGPGPWSKVCCHRSSSSSRGRSPPAPRPWPKVAELCRAAWTPFCLAPTWCRGLGGSDVYMKIARVS